MSENKKREVHPIVKRALEIAHQEFNNIDVDDYAIEKLQEMFKHLFGKPKLSKTVHDLINLAGLLDEQGSRSASMKLMIIISNTADVLKALEERLKED